MNQPKKILLLCSASHSLKNFRGDLIKHFIANNYEVYCGGPDFDEISLQDVKDLGGTPVSFNLQRTGVNPLKDYRSIDELKNILEKHKIDLLFPYTIKPVIYGSFAAKKINIPVVSLITGLGFTFSKVTFKAQLLQLITQILYRRALKKNKAIVFQNKDDLQLFLDNKIVTNNQSLHVVNGSGINLDRFSFTPKTKSNQDGVKFVIVGRLLKEKGFQYFMNAAKQLKSAYPKAEFHIIGGVPGNNSSAISKSELNDLNTQGIIIYHGVTHNVPELISQMDVFVLPTYYREGVPRSILEALSTGLPVITTNTPGCKETVIENVNGFLIPPKDEENLVKALKKFLDNPKVINKMSIESRKLAEVKFDVNIINRELLKIIET
ncbi:glycosyltransferase family 4 protein [Aurantibacter sp.]|uniref:glycosyltransferase family 4 protein n=1 Tax=Aurantibacter sp. TaxID=2807103 RepID=UPI0032661B11